MAIKKTITDSVGNSTAYHRIDSSIFNFNKNQVIISIRSYVNEFYRDAEKAEIDSNAEKVKRYYELSGKSDKTVEETAELQSLNIAELEAIKYTERDAKASIVTFDIPQEIRDWLYSLVASHPDFADSIEA